MSILDILFAKQQGSAPTDSTIWTWGQGNAGQLGDNTAISKSSPVSVVGGFTDWDQVSAGTAHGLGLRSDGSAWAWGNGTQGRLGDNSAVTKSSPVSVVGGFTWDYIAACNAHSLGVKSDGTAWAWGGGTNGKLGDGTTVSKSSPVSVLGGFTDWTQVSGSEEHSLGVRSNGTAWAWGSGSNGRLGDNSAAAKSSPVSVAGGFTDWVQVSAGAAQSAGRRSNGTIWGWGENTFGRLGDGTTSNRTSPVSVVGGFTDWIDVSSGGGHGAGVRSNGTIWCWGRNSSGELGDGTTTGTSSPVSVVGGFTDWVAVAASIDSTVGLRSNGTVWAWGNATAGKLGDNSLVSKSSPVQVVGGFTSWQQISQCSAGGSNFVAGIVLL